MTTNCLNKIAFRSELLSYEVSVNELPEIDKICSVWADSAELRILNTEEDAKINSLADSARMLRQIASCASGVFVSQSKDPILFHKVIDSQGTTQSIGCSWIDDSEITIMYLATNPSNIFPLPNETVCRGAGTEVVFSCIRKAIELGIPEIKLRSLPLAKSFYTKLGFEVYEKSNGRNLDRMKLTAEKIWDLYPHFIVPGVAA